MAPAGDPGRARRVQGRDQGSADDAGRGRHPLAQRDAAPGAGPVLVHPPGALDSGGAVAGEGAAQGGHGRLPREHGGRLRGDRVGVGHPRGGGGCATFSMSEMGASIREASGIGIKPISPFGTKRHVAAAIRYALARGRDSVTLMHKGNIMKFTEGSFRDWGYEVAAERFPDSTVPESRLWEGEEADGTRGDQGPDRRLDVPAGAAPSRRVLGDGDAEPQRGLPVGRLRGPGGRDWGWRRARMWATRWPSSRRPTEPRPSTRG